MFSRSVLFSSSLLLLVACSGESFQDVKVSSSAGAAGVSGGQTSAGQAGSGGGQENPGGNAGTGGIAGQSGSGGTEESGGGGIAQGGNGGNSAGEGGDGGQAGLSGQAGSGGSGIPCGQQKFSCSGDVLFACENGVLVEKKTCGSGLCDSIKGDCLTCVADQAIECFNETTVLTCDASGTGKVLVSCTGEKPFCSQGQCVSCVKDTDCKEELDCYKASCGGGVCLQEPLLEGTVAKAQTPNDCQQKVCDGKGSTKSIPDTEDLPVAPSACVMGTCDESGTPGEAPVAVGASCGDAGVCNGKGACGVCVPGEVACDGTGSIHTCQEDGSWGKTEKCPTATPACSKDVCVGVTQLASGESHSCALLSDGTVRCWGSNAVGQLGVGLDKATATQPSPVGLSEVVQISLGNMHSCALLKGGEVMCWGLNIYGAVGDGTGSSHSFSPKVVKSSLKFSQVVSAGYHSCAISVGGDVLCWGNNDYSQTGHQSPETIEIPSVVLGVSDAEKVVAGLSHTCILDSNKDVYCWGSNNEGQLGLPSSTQESFVPQKIVELSGVAENIISGDNHMIATKPSGDPGRILDVWFWGSGSHRQNFQNQGVNLFTPKKEILSDAGSKAERFFAGFRTTSYLAYGLIFSVGDNSDGQLGSGQKDASWGSAVLESLLFSVEVAPGAKHMCARQETGKVWCWGQGSQGQLGNGDTSAHLTPVEVVWLHSGNPLDESSVTLEVVLHACH